MLPVPTLWLPPCRKSTSRSSKGSPLYQPTSTLINLPYEPRRGKALLQIAVAYYPVYLSIPSNMEVYSQKKKNQAINVVSKIENISEHTAYSSSLGIKPTSILVDARTDGFQRLYIRVYETKPRVFT